MDFLQNIDFENINSAGSLYSATNQLARRYGLRVHTGNDRETDEIYMILSCERVFNVRLCSKYGNGAVFIYRNHTLVPVCLPSKLCLRHNKVHQLHNYVIYDIIDGTTINLYYYNNNWRIATKHSHNAGELVWRDVQYKEEFDRLAKTCPEFSWDALDIGKTYSLIMASTQMNPLNNDTQTDTLFFISAQDNKTGQYYFENTIGVNTQKRTIAKSYPSFGCIYRSIDQKGFDYISRSSSYNDLRRLLYNVPAKDIPFICNNFKHTDCMILCAIAQGEIDFEEKVPLLATRTAKLRQFIEETIQHIIDVKQGNAKANNDYTHQFVEDTKKYNLETVISILRDLRGVEFLYNLYVKSQYIDEQNETTSELATGENWDN